MGKRGGFSLVGLGTAIILLLILARDVAVWGYADRLLAVAFGTSAEARPLSVGTNVWPGYEPLYLARGLDLYGGAPIRLVEYSSATQVIRAYRNGTIDVAALTLDEVLLLRESRLDARVFLVTDVSHGGDVILSQPEIEDLAGLRGRRIAVENTALGAYMLARALQTVGLDPADVTMEPHEIDEHEQVFATRQVDAVVTFEPVRSRLLATGARQIFDSSRIPGEIVDVLVATPALLDQQSGQVTALLEAWFVALAYLEEQPEDAARRMAPRLRIEPSAVLDSFAGLRLPDLLTNVSMLTGSPAPLRQSALRLSTVMSEHDLLRQPVDLDHLLAPAQLLGLRDSDEDGSG